MIIQPPTDTRFPLVSCVCCTYDRPKLLAEAIQCFLDQTYENKELIVLNDNPNARYHLDKEYPNVRIINAPQRFPSLGQKRNAFKQLIKGEYVCIWDDDDLYGFNRITDSVKHFDSKYDMLKPSMSLVSVNNANYEIRSNVFHSATCVKASTYRRIKYRNMSVGEDLAFESEATKTHYNPGCLVWYIYRWGNTNHISGLSDTERAWEIGADRNAHIQGDIEITPTYHQNYWQDIYNYYQHLNHQFAKVWRHHYLKYME